MCERTCEASDTAVYVHALIGAQLSASKQGYSIKNSTTVSWTTFRFCTDTHENLKKVREGVYLSDAYVSTSNEQQQQYAHRL